MLARAYPSRGFYSSAFAPVPALSSDLLAIRRRRDSHRLPILGHRATRNIDLFGAQHLGDRLIREWALRSFRRNHPADLFLDRLGAHIFAAGALYPRGEEKFQLENSLRRMRVLVGGRAAARRFMHPDVFGDIL